MTSDTHLRDALLAQYEMAWTLAEHHLRDLTTEECLWRPAPEGLHVVLEPTGRWRADWPDRETYDLGPPSIAWISWHVCFWWSNALEGYAGRRPREPEEVEWPGTAEAVRGRIYELSREWRDSLLALSDPELEAPHAASWPLPDSNRGAVAAWLNLELMKNTAELGLVRFLHAVRPENGPATR